MTKGRIRQSEFYRYGKSFNGIMHPNGTDSVYYNGALLWETQNVGTHWNMHTYSIDSCTDQLHKKAGKYYDEGGPLDIAKVIHTVQLSDEFDVIAGNPSGVQWRYKGRVIPQFVGSPIFNNELPPVTFGDCSSYGATAWHKYKPGKPKVDAAQFLAELKDLPSMLKGTAKRYKELFGDDNRFKAAMSLRKIGGDHLNMQFGWLPFLSDLRKMYTLANGMHAALSKLKKENGKWLYRRGSVFEQDEVQTTWSSDNPIQGCMWPALNTYLVLGRSSQGSASYGRRVWFAGRFRYHYPELEVLGDGGWSQFKRMRRVWGLYLTPSLVWELTPWSWLIDYFSNVGDIISNMSTSGECVAKYAYVMGNTSYKLSQTSSMLLVDGRTIKANIEHETVYRQRVSANPYGFQMSDAMLTAHQVGILAALGFTKYR